MSPVLVLIGLAFLLTKMGRPMHLPLTYFHFNPSSPLWWGGVFQPIFLIGAFFYAKKWNQAEEKEKDPSRMYLGVVMGVLALIVGAYHGLLLGVVTARPLWSAGPTVVSAIFAFISTGTAAVMLVHLIRMKMAGRLTEEDPSKRFFRDMALARAVMLSALLIQLGTFFLWYLSLKTGSLQAREALAAANEAYGTTFWALGITIGLVIPLALIALAFLREGKVLVKRQVPILFATCVMILIGGYYFRLSVVLGGQVPLPIASLN